MKMLCIFFKKVVRGQVCPAAKPAVNDFVLRIVQFKIAPVGMYCGHKRVERVKHQAEPAGKPFFTVDLKLAAHSLAYLPIYHGSVYAAFLQHITVGDHSCFAAAAAVPFPFVFCKTCFPVGLFQSSADPVLQRVNICYPCISSQQRIFSVHVSFLF